MTDLNIASGIKNCSTGIKSEDQSIKKNKVFFLNNFSGILAMLYYEKNRNCLLLLIH